MAKWTKTDPISGRTTTVYSSKSPGKGYSSSGASSSSKSTTSSSSKSSSSSSSKPSSSSSSSRYSSSSSSGTKTSSSGQKLYSDGYGGWTTKPSTSKDYADTYGGSSKTQTTRPSSGGSSSSGSSGSSAASRPVSGGSSMSGSSVQYSGSSGTSSGGSANYHQDAIDAAARGDWSAVAKALAARQAKINAQGGNDRGTSNAAILASLQKQYADSYNALSKSNQSTISGMATGSINGMATNPRGWDDGRDYLADAKQYAQSGQLDAAYDALLRRGFKMYDTGSTGGGTSQDQAYALIRNLYNQSGMARQEYNDQVARNAQRLAEHPTQFGTGTNPALANKHFVSQDGQFIIYYDSTGTPVAAKPNNGDGYSRQYSPEEIELMRQYYSGADGVDFAELQRQIHNNNVAYTGNGRLIDQYGNYASGTPVGTTDMYHWDPTAIPGTQYNVNQDVDALKAILDRINAGESFGSLGGGSGAGSPVTVPTLPSAPSVSQPSGSYSGYGTVGTGSLAGLDDSGLADLLKQLYAQNLDAQLAGLRSTYEQDYAGIRAQDDLISRLYANQRNQAAVQNDIQRMQMAEFGAMRGLNTGASGQMALAQSASYQNALGELGAAESQSLADNALNAEKLSAGYRSSVDQARAANNADLAQALYSEYVRQINAAQQAQAQALAQQNWERQFAYQQQQDALSQSNWEKQFAYGQQQDEYDRASALQQLLYKYQHEADSAAASSAADWAELLLKNGAMPDAELLAAAGISSGSAQAMTDAYWKALNLKNTPKTSYSGGSKSSGGTSYPKSGTAGGDYEGLFAAAKASGYPKAFISNNFKNYGFSSSSGLFDGYQDWEVGQGTPAQSGGQSSDSTGYGIQYAGINQTLYYMKKMGKSKAEMKDFLERQTASDLSDNGYKNLIQNYGL